jgi:equilibrative nucleoside transporter 1/2/3
VIVIAGRVAFFFVLLLIASKTDYGYLIESDWFAILISFLFAVTNGYSTAALMTIGPELTEDPKKKEIIGFINSFGLTFGISCGTFGALAFKNANKWSF